MSTIDFAALRRSVDMVALVGRWITLKRSGKAYVGRCPFHEDIEPSFAVYPGHAHCYGCGWHGGAISFVKDKLGIDFPAAVRWLEEHIGELPRQRQRVSSRTHTPTHPIPRMVLDYWVSMVSPEVRDYYRSRGLTDATIDYYMLGWDGRAYVLPVWEGEPGNSLVFGVRYRRKQGAEEGPKYWGIRGRNQPRLFNKWLLEDAKEAIVFIGEFDAMLGWQDGLCSVSATSGQNTWLVGWNRLFKDAQHIYVVPDYGEATAGFTIASQFLGKAKVCLFPKWAKDYTAFRLAGYTVEQFRSEILKEG